MTTFETLAKQYETHVSSKAFEALIVSLTAFEALIAFVSNTFVVVELLSCVRGGCHFGGSRFVDHV